MDREILFRAKSTNKSKWLYGYFIQALDIDSKPLKNCIIENMSNFDVPSGRLKQDCYEIELETLGQYTGRKDWNEKKIFEGDILKHTCQIDGETIEQNYLVKFTDGAFRLFQRIDDPWSLDLLNEETLECGHYVVIGNIHDNKELME